MSARDGRRRCAARSSAGSRSRRFCPASSSTGRRGCRAAAARRRCSPTASCAGSGGRAASRSRGRRPSTGSRPRSPRRASLRPCSLVPRRGARAEPRASATTRSRSSGCSRWRASPSPPPSWDVANGFSLMGASRDLTLSVFVEATLVLSLAVAALVAGTTDLRGDRRRRRPAADVWASPALALGALAFALVVVAETGRQPVDNPDTHLELTMIHEGPLLEYAGRDLAYLQWAAAARHWLVLVLAAQVFLPHPRDVWWQLALLPVALVVLCGGARARRDARREDAHPARAAAARGRRRGCAARDRRSAGGLAVSGALAWALVALGLAVVVVRRRSLAVALVTAQALVLVGVRAAPRRATRRGRRRRRRALRSARSCSPALFLLLVVAHARDRGRCARASRRSRAAASPSRSRWRLTWLVPAIGLDSRDAERGVLALVAFGIATAGDAPGDALPGASASSSSRTGSRSPRSSSRAARRSRSSSASRST